MPCETRIWGFELQMLRHAYRNKTVRIIPCDMERFSHTFICQKEQREKRKRMLATPSTMIAVLFVLSLVVNVNAQHHHYDGVQTTTKESLACCEWEAQAEGGKQEFKQQTGAVQIGSRIYSCGYPSADLTYSFVHSQLKCTCNKPQDCSRTVQSSSRDSGATGAFISQATQKRLPLSRFNDEYCDTGDDEPNTSACAGTPRESLFYCSGGIPKTLPLSRVNDGVVDCCDCSDEPAMRSKCDPQLCATERYELEREQRERDEIIIGGLHELATIAKTSVNELNKLKADVNDQNNKLAQFANEIAEQRRNLEREEEHERQEQEEKRLAAWQKLIAILDENVPDVNVLADVVAKFALKRGEIGVTKLRQTLTDAVPEDKDLCIDYRRVLSENGPDVEQNVAKIISWDESTQGSQDERSKLLMTTLQLAQAPRTLLWRAVRQLDSEDDGRRVVELLKEQLHGAFSEQATAAVEPILSDMVAHNVRPGAEAARNAVRELEGRESEFKSRISKLEKFVSLDFGPNATLIHLLNKEFVLQAGEHLYKLRPFEQCEQGSTSLGKYTGWKPLQEGSSEIPQEINEGKGVPKPSILMTFENGLRCYQGTVRSTSVYMRCGKGDALVSVFEPEVCRYVYLFRTPVACLESSVLLESTESLVSSLWRKAKSLFSNTK